MESPYRTAAQAEEAPAPHRSVRLRDYAIGFILGTLATLCAVPTPASSTTPVCDLVPPASVGAASLLRTVRRCDLGWDDSLGEHGAYRLWLVHDTGEVRPVGRPLDTVAQAVELAEELNCRP